MDIRCIWEHNGDDSLLYSDDFPGVFTRGENLLTAKRKMADELRSYFRWASLEHIACSGIEIIQESSCDLNVRDADSDVLFQSEVNPLQKEDYERLKALSLKSAADFRTLYMSIPDKNRTDLSERSTFYGSIPRTAEEMYQHTKNVNAYYFGEIGIEATNEGDILTCRTKGFDALEMQPDFLHNHLFDGSYGEAWTLRKVLRRFVWHDRIHAKAMYRMATRVFGAENVENPFCFEEKLWIPESNLSSTG